jgi:hypothetical protein
MVDRYTAWISCIIYQYQVCISGTLSGTFRVIILIIDQLHAFIHRWFIIYVGTNHRSVADRQADKGGNDKVELTVLILPYYI